MKTIIINNKIDMIYTDTHTHIQMLIWDSFDGREHKLCCCIRSKKLMNLSDEIEIEQWKRVWKKNAQNMLNLDI